MKPLAGFYRRRAIIMPTASLGVDSQRRVIPVIRLETASFKIFYNLIETGWMFRIEI